jgi:two-component system, NtrC family, response regulator GlrR
MGSSGEQRVIVLLCGAPISEPCEPGLAARLSVVSAAWSAEAPPPWRGRASDVVVVHAVGNGAFERVEALRAERPSAPALVLLPETAAPELWRAASECADDFMVWPGRAAELEQRVLRLIAASAEGAGAVARRLSRQEALGEFVVGDNPGYRALVAALPRFAQDDTTLLILGETGTGKELCARALHELGPRREAPFVVVDCGALPDHLLENELFGHVRGAYTDARGEQRGLVALAQGGTLFFDEIDALPLGSQAKLLRLLQERSYRPLGSDRRLTADVRVLAATNADLPALIAERQFRRDLYHRLNVLRLELPPLRERAEDIPALALHFARTFARSLAGCVELTPRAVAQLVAYDWPGNVRELENVVRRALLMLPPESRNLDAFDIACPAVVAVDQPMNATFREARAKVLAEFERSFLVGLLDRHRGNVTRAAREAGKDRRALGRLLKKYEIGRTGS